MRLKGEIFTLDNFTVVFKVLNDLFLFIVSDQDENEIVFPFLLWGSSFNQSRLWFFPSRSCPKWLDASKSAFLT